jgi:hypothetical protein
MTTRRIELTAAPPVEVRKGPRRRRNDGMLTPVRLLDFNDPFTGRGQLVPGRTFVALDWWGARERPELFRLANKGDVYGAREHRRMLDRALHQLERGTTRTRRGTTRTRTTRTAACRLPSLPRREWKLP